MQMKNLTLVCFTAVLLAACSSVPKPAVDSSRAAAAVPTAPAAAAPAMPAAPAVAAVKPVPAYLDPGNPISTQRSVFFGFDDASVTADSFAVVERQGRYLAANPRVKVTIEGNTDERGGAEYNLALGQKRAEAVLRAMKVYGAGDSQMEAISWGREKPRAAGHDEAAWARNRRADVVYPVR
jgi:peptidoglycan-associated lipoprotein